MSPDKTKPNYLFIALSILGALFMLFFGLRAFRAFKKFDGHRPPFPEHLQTDVNDIEDWMTIPFISHNYGVPPDVLFEALNISQKENHKKSLKQINDETFAGQDGYVLETVRQTILAHQPPAPLDSPNDAGAPLETPPPATP